MESILTISVVCVFITIASTSSAYDGRPSFFRHRGDPIERRSSPDEPNQQSIANQWIKRYYHVKNPELEKSPIPSPTFLQNTPDEFLWLMKSLLSQQPHGNSEVGGYPIDQEDVDALIFNPSLNEDDDNTDGTIDYTDLYNFSPRSAGPSQIDDNFQRALADYLMLQKVPPGYLSKGSDKQVESGPDSIKSIVKGSAMVEIPRESSTSSGSSTLSMLSAPVKVTSEAASSTAVTSSSNNLSVMPPVSVGKGQKEFPMLRPASENTRKFDNWAQSFEKAMPVNIPEELQHPTLNQQYPVDSLTEELNRLKSQSRHGIKRSRPMWY